jgi:hypothetical protein
MNEVEKQFTVMTSPMRTKSWLAFLAATVLAGSSGYAVLYTDKNTHNDVMEEGDVVTGKWSYGPIGSGETVTSVETWFKFASSDSAYEEYQVLIGTGEGPVDYTSGEIQFNGLVIGHWYFDSGSILSDAANGYLSYRVEATATPSGNYNDFEFKWAKVEVRTAEGTGTTTRNHGVPDGGGTVALLGVGLLGFWAFRRRSA